MNVLLMVIVFGVHQLTDAGVHQINMTPWMVWISWSVAVGRPYTVYTILQLKFYAVML